MPSFRNRTKRTTSGLTIIGLICICSFFHPIDVRAQPASVLDKMPADLETAFALSALPRYRRTSATVYLLDTTKGYYVARKGSNGCACLISRTGWEWGKFR